jgi:Zn-dependent protease with chaperone function
MTIGRYFMAGAVLAFLGLSACGTSYTVPSISAGSEATAKAMFAQERAVTKRRTTSSKAAAARFDRVVSRVKPVAMAFCQQEAAKSGAKPCDLPVFVDTKMPVANAYHTRDDQDRPFVAFTVPMLMQIENDDELAFILGHEYGHHIADHIEKSRQQALAGAIIMGALTATSQAYASQGNPYRYTGGDSAEMQRNMQLGAAVGQKAYSQSYELESDVLATYITKQAGYDPVKGAKFFARPAAARTSNGNLSFWGTHPPDAKRLATVIETAKSAEAGQALARKK